MKLASLLNQELICVRAPVTSKDEAVDLLVQRLYKHYPFELDKTAIEKGIREREALGETVFKTGIAIPHARLEKLNDLLIGICIPEHPFTDGKITVRMVVLILTDIASSTMYLNTLAAFTSITKDEASFGKLLASSNANDFIETIKDLNIQIKKQLAVSDIMTKNVISVPSKATLKELFDLCVLKRISYVPVLDDNGDFIGEVTISDALKVGIPEYVTMIGNINFLTSLEPFETLLRTEQTMSVAQIMRKPSFKLSESTSILEAALELTQNKRRHIPVVEGNKIVGIVSIMDFLTKVLRG